MGKQLAIQQQIIDKQGVFDEFFYTLFYMLSIECVFLYPLQLGD
jgi:hypothetical protein